MTCSRACCLSCEIARRAETKPSTDNDQFIDEVVPDESEQLDQLETDRSLVDRGLRDPLEEGRNHMTEHGAGH